jgi:hypothetical protein
MSDLQRTCARQVCGKTFTWTRADQTYCTPACRVRSWRDAQKDTRTVRARAVRAVLIAIDRLADVATQDDWDEVADYFGRTVRARKEGES